MLTLHENHARLQIGHDEAFQEVTESVRSLLQVCRVNRLPAALVVSEQDDFDWRSSLRVAVRFYCARYPLPRLRLALVKAVASPALARELAGFIRQMGLECQTFGAEAAALAWLTARPPT
jgi:hypothetical protein